ncbi:MAG: hypothetical protein HF978_03415 [Desulfobacteraceae bacterium]|nr:hypothetical protein [Desulfobacteraceae bacterium]MBC2754574.1 hypothetical protein [Desulfobacteraceae bacterium]
MAKGKEFKKFKPKSTKNFKTGEIQDPINYDLCKPIFSFYNMQYGQNACLSQCDLPNKSSVTDKIVLLSQLTWREIKSQPRTKLGYEKIPQQQFNVSLPNPPVTPEVSIKVFRHSGSGRIAGYRVNDVYHILVVGDNLYNH